MKKPFVALATAILLLLIASSVQQYHLRIQQSQLSIESGSRSCSISGKIVDAETRSPLVGALITVRDASSGSATKAGRIGAYCRSKNGGEFSIASFDPGTYKVFARHVGYVGLSYGTSSPLQAGTNISVNNQNPHATVSFALYKESSISGLVLGFGNAPLRLAHVSLLEYRFEEGRRILVPIARTNTDSFGRYQLLGLKAGEYYCKASYEENGSASEKNTPVGTNEGYVQTYFPSTISLQHAARIIVPPASVIKNITLTMKRGKRFHISGVIANFEALNRPSVTLSVVPVDPSDDFVGEIRQFRLTGLFQIRVATPGLYMLRASASIGSYQYSDAQPVRLGNRDVRNIRLKLMRNHSLEGRIQTRDSYVPDFKSIRVVLKPYEPLRTFSPGVVQVNQNGAFTFQNVACGRYKVLVEELPEHCYIESLQQEGYDLLANDLYVHGDATNIKIEGVLNSAAGLVEGIVKNQYGGIANGAMVFLYPSQNTHIQIYGSAHADQYGRFRIDNVSPGSYRLIAMDGVLSGYQPIQASLYKIDKYSASFMVGEKNKVTKALEVVEMPSSQ